MVDNINRLCYTKIEKVKELLEGLVQKGFYGEVYVKFEAGHVVICKKTESIKM